MTNGRGRMIATTDLVKSAADSTANVTSNRWPASMLAKSRTASENGCRMSTVRSSMKTTSGRKAAGTPGGTSAFFTYLAKP